MQLKPATTTYPAIVGCLLANARIKEDLDQSEFAEKMDVSQSTWSRIERGDSPLTVEQLYRAAHALGQKPSKILSLADSATDGLKRSGVNVQDMQIKDAIQQGLAVIGFAALCVLVAKLIAK